MDDSMRFTPNRIEVKAGETIRFVVHNDGKTEHEMVLGSEEEMNGALAAWPEPVVWVRAPDFSL